MEEVDIIEAWGFNDENWVHETIADEMRQTQEEEEGGEGENPPYVWKHRSSTPLGPLPKTT